MNSSAELKAGLETALRHDSQAVVERCVAGGVEVTCTVHDITQDELLEAFPVTEITPEGEVFHSTNYTSTKFPQIAILSTVSTILSRQTRHKHPKQDAAWGGNTAGQHITVYSELQCAALQVTKVAKVAYRALNLCGIATFDMIVQVW